MTKLPHNKIACFTIARYYVHNCYWYCWGNIQSICFCICISPKIDLQFVLWNLIIFSEFLFHLDRWGVGGSMTSQLSFALLCCCHTRVSVSLWPAKCCFSGHKQNIQWQIVAKYIYVCVEKAKSSALFKTEEKEMFQSATIACAEIVHFSTDLMLHGNL